MFEKDLTFQTNVLYFCLKQLFRNSDMAISDKNISSGSTSKWVQDRLLDAAEQLFCEQGFDGTSIRDIAAAAGCNIAAINYYFGGKDKLYIEVWRRHLHLLRETRIASINKVMSQKDEKPSLEELLRSYANAFVEPLVDESRGRRFIRLMAREMVDQHLPKDMFLKEMIIPVMTALQKALVQIRPGLDQSKARLAILSLVGQLIHTIGAKTMFEQTDYPELPKFDLTEAVNHIVKFSAAGIRACAAEKKEP
jgi:AcrR family transcriptional regulator